MEFLERVFVALGSNLEPRGAHLAAGREMLRRVAVGGWKESPIYETPPIGPGNQGNYYNQVVSFWYTRGEGRLLNYLKGSELFLGRKRRSHWGAREIDLDLLFYGNVISKERPSLPHPEIYNRQFVLVPLCDIAPEWVDPVSGSTVQDLLNRLQVKEGSLHFKKIKEP